MTPRTLAEAEALYEVAVNGTMHWDVIEFEPFESFSTTVQKLQRAVSRELDEPIWVDAVRRLRTIRSALTVAPVPFNHPSHHLAQQLGELSTLFSRARTQHSGEPVHLLRDAISQVQNLKGRKDNPLGDRALELMDTVSTGNRGILLPVGRLVEPAADVLQRRPSGAGVRLLTPADLAEAEPFEILVVLGSTYWYRRHPFVFSAPRARQVHLLKWAWINDALPSAELLLGSRSGSKQIASESMLSRRRDTVEAEELAPSVDWTAIADRVHQTMVDQGELVAARMLLLAEGWAVAVSADDGATVRVVEPDLVGDQRIEKIGAAVVEEGDYILLRSHGGGELIVALADQNLGAKLAHRLRVSQRAWKDALRTEVGRSTSAEVARRLRQLGSTKANCLNLRNWQSQRSLRTKDRADFFAIMALIGMGDRADTLWNEMGVLTRAHQQAGVQITSLLREAVVEADLSTLVSTGIMEFQLAGQDVGNLTVCRVDAVGPSLIEVNENALGRRVPAGDLWLA